MRNLDQPVSFYFNVTPSERVSLAYTNSMYDAPVEEVFEVRDGEIFLKEVRTRTPAVLEYYGFEGTEPVQDLHTRLGSSFSIQASTTQNQAIKVGRNRLDVRVIAHPGDRILVSVDQVSPAEFLWLKIH